MRYRGIAFVSSAIGVFIWGLLLLFLFSSFFSSFFFPLLFLSSLAFLSSLLAASHLAAAARLQMPLVRLCTGRCLLERPRCAASTRSRRLLALLARQPAALTHSHCALPPAPRAVLCLSHNQRAQGFGFGFSVRLSLARACLRFSRSLASLPRSFSPSLSLLSPVYLRTTTSSLSHWDPQLKDRGGALWIVSGGDLDFRMRFASWAPWPPGGAGAVTVISDASSTVVYRQAPGRPSASASAVTRHIQQPALGPLFPLAPLFWLLSAGLVFSGALASSPV